MIYNNEKGEVYKRPVNPALTLTAFLHGTILNDLTRVVPPLDFFTFKAFRRHIEIQAARSMLGPLVGSVSAALDKLYTKGHYNHTLELYNN